VSATKKSERRRRLGRSGNGGAIEPIEDKYKIYYLLFDLITEIVICQFLNARNHYFLININYFCRYNLNMFIYDSST